MHTLFSFSSQNLHFACKIALNKNNRGSMRKNIKKAAVLDISRFTAAFFYLPVFIF